jgi:hypothetical protein
MNTYCTERKYGSENLTDGFKEKFSNFFVKKYEGKDVEQEEMIADLHFNLDTAFSASVDINAALKNSFESKKTEYETQIAELNKKLGKVKNPPTVEIPKEVQDQLDELKAFKNKEAKKSKFENIMALAKKGIRQDLHKSFETFANGTDVDLEKEDKEQANALVSRFQEIFKDSIGDIKPLAPQQTRKNDEAVLSQLKRLKV